MTTSARKHLFKPIKLASKTLKNRIVFGAHTANMSDQGLPGPRHRGYYAERARGGAAMIVVEPMPVHRTAVLTRGNFLHDDNSVIPHFSQLVETCKQHGTIMIQQLYHVGAHGDADLSFEPNWSPSGRSSYHDSDGSHAMSQAQIEEVIAGFISSAKRCQQAGFDGVDIFAPYHSLVEQFWTPWSNRRKDQWGGSLTNRMRFSSRILAGIKAACGQDFILGLSISYSANTSVTLSLEELQTIIASHDSAGHIDYVSCGSGNYIDYDAVMPTFVHGEKMGSALASAMKAVVTNAAVTAESHYRTPENADYAVASGEADLVSIVRGQIADPHLANKALQGREEDIRGCISCNQMCWGRRSRDYWISCLINPSAGREFEWGGDRFSKASQPKKVLVVGGGPAGLECARVAAERGHTVTLCEASPELGGQFRLAGLAPRRGQILELLSWYQIQLQKLGVDLRYNSPMDADDVQAFTADEVVLATGSMPDGSGYQRWLAHEDELPGLANGGVWSVEDVLRREAKLGQKIILIDEGGNWRGAGTAWYLAEKGHQVTLVTPDAFVGKELARTTADFQVRKKLLTLGAKFMVESVITHWHGPGNGKGKGATVRSLIDGSETRVEASALVLATTNIAFNELELELADTNLVVQTIGDCVAPRQAAYAFHEGRKLGLSL